jgi:hypothetical protein
LFEVSQTAYGYAGGSPLNSTDPTGLLRKQDVANGAGGVLNGLTFGHEKAITGLLGISDHVERCSGAYHGGQIAGTAALFVMPGGDAEAAAETAAADELPGYSSFRAAKADLGSPGAGNVYDHVVEQSQIGRSGFAPEEIHNPFNMNPVSAETNQLKANYYSSKQFFTGGGTVRDWLTGQSFVDQYEFGMDVRSRIEQGLPLP